ncbi:hypothetical protein CL614_07290 [archaeon]|nr:hypothetical protein [archaeon]|tara:strand:- start:2688 stop:2954 length:267 start_codon:yes stop_codon:yes gene_type:complete
MTYLCFLAQAAVCRQALDKALPEMQKHYGDDYLSSQDVKDTIGSIAIFNMQKKIRDGQVIGLSESHDCSLIGRLAAEIPKMYEEALRK